MLLPHGGWVATASPASRAFGACDDAQLIIGTIFRPFFHSRTVTSPRPLEKNKTLCLKALPVGLDGHPLSPRGCAALHASQSSLPCLPALPGGHRASMRGMLCVFV